jgi:hypothetical protein
MPPLSPYARARIYSPLRTRPRVQRAPGIPCALLFSRVNPIKTRAHRAARPRRYVLYEAEHEWHHRATRLCSTVLSGPKSRARRPFSPVSERRNNAHRGTIEMKSLAIGCILICGAPCLAQTQTPSQSVPTPTGAISWGALFKKQGGEGERAQASFSIKLKRDGTLDGKPLPDKDQPTPYLRSYQDSALRAIVQCQPYSLPAASFDEWRNFAPVFADVPPH